MEEKVKKPRKTAAEKLAESKTDAGNVAEAVPELMNELGFENVKAIAKDDKVLVSIDLSDLQRMQQEKEELAKAKAELKKQQEEMAKVKEKPAPAPKTVAKPTTTPKPEAKKESKPVVKSPRSEASARKFHNRLHEKYIKEVVPALTPKYKNVMAVPKIDKIILNMGLGDCKDDTKKFTGAVEELGLITGQKPVVTKAKKSISNFKLREGQRIGAKVTLRGPKMYLFLDKLISIALPRVRDFNGLNPKSFDQFGNYAMGIKEQLVFPEISYEKVEKIRGFDIAIVTTAKDKVDSLELLKAMGFPFKGGSK